MEENAIAVMGDRDGVEEDAVIKKPKVKPLERLFIPTIGTHIRLRKPWTFDLYDERRNSGLLDACGFYDKQLEEEDDNGPSWGVRYGWGRGRFNNRQGRQSTYGKPVLQVTLPRGTELKIARIYVRSGNDMYKFDSVTFQLIKKSLPKKLQSLGEKGKHGGSAGRFWVKLGDANNVVCEVVEDE
tara:strand:+ start:1206 stop:1757 length:552 start_codon:yes stop_codon:yes gene_type:complete